MSLPEVESTTANTVNQKKPRAKGVVGQRKRQWKWSYFYYTYNTNRHFEQNDPALFEMADKLEAALEYISSTEHVGEFIKINKANAAWAWTKDHVREINADNGVERGKERGYLHSHSLLQINHDMLIHLDFEKMNKFLNEKTGVLKGNLHVRVLKSQAQDLEYVKEYIYKDLVGKEPEGSEPITSNETHEVNKELIESA